MGKVTRILNSITQGIFSTDAGSEPLETGAALPHVIQKNQDNLPVNLAEAGAHGHLLVYFYPKADTPGCTRQACSLRDSYADLTERGVLVFGVSSDSADAQKAFREKFNLPFTLLADEDGAVTNAFGVPKTLGFTKRQAFLFRDGILVWRDLSASTTRQAADVIEVIAGA